MKHQTDAMECERQRKQQRVMVSHSSNEKNGEHRMPSMNNPKKRGT